MLHDDGPAFEYYKKRVRGVVEFYHRSSRIFDGQDLQELFDLFFKFDYFISNVIWGENRESEKDRAVYSFGKRERLHVEADNTLTGWISLYDRWNNQHGRSINLAASPLLDPMVGLFHQWYVVVQVPAFEKVESVALEKLMKKVMDCK